SPTGAWPFGDEWCCAVVAGTLFVGVRIAGVAAVRCSGSATRSAGSAARCAGFAGRCAGVRRVRFLALPGSAGFAAELRSRLASFAAEPEVRLASFAAEPDARLASFAAESDVRLASFAEDPP